MTATPRRTVRVGDTLWFRFLARHGKRGASARLRHLMLLDLESTEPPAATTRGSDTTKQTATQSEATK